MTTYRVLADFDRDGFMHADTASTDALNLIPSPVLYKGLFYKPMHANTVVTLQNEATDYGVKSLRVEMNAASGAGVGIGMNPADDTISTIPVTAGNEYTFKVWTRVEVGVSDDETILRADTQAGATIATSATFFQTTSYVAHTLTFTAPVGCTHVRLCVLKDAPYSAITIYCTGFGLYAGASAPTAFNAGHALNWRDDITDYITALEFADGMISAYDGIAQTARMVLQLENRSGLWLPENSGSALYGALSKGMLVRVEADHSGTTYPLWQGTIKQYSVSPDSAAPFVSVTLEDAMQALLDTTYDPPLLTDTTTGAALESLFDSGAVLYPYPGVYGILDAAGYAELDSNMVLFENTITDFDAGQTELAYIGDNTDQGAGVGVQAYIADLIGADLGGRFAYDARTGKFVFHDRHRDILHDGAVTTLSRASLETSATTYLWGDDLINDLTVGYYPRRLGTPASVMFTLGDVPMRLGIQQTRTFTAQYRITGSPQNVGGIDMLDPVSGTDFTVVSEDGSATPDARGIRLGLLDFTKFLLVHVEFGATSAKVTIQNTHSEAINLTLFQLRGTPLISDVRQTVSSRNGVSIGDQGIHRLTIDLPALGDDALAQQYADYLVNRFDAPIGRIADVTIPAHKSDALMTKALSLGFGDFVTVTDNYLTNAQDKYVVVGRRHAFDIGGGRHDVTLTLRPVERETWMILDAADALLDTAVLAL